MLGEVSNKKAASCFVEVSNNSTSKETEGRTFVSVKICIGEFQGTGPLVVLLQTLHSSPEVDDRIV